MPVQVPIRVATSALLVHDVVNDFLDPAGPEPDPGLDAVLANVRALLAAARQARLAVVFAAPGQGDPAIAPRHQGGAAPTRLVWGTRGVEVPSDLGPLPGEKMVRKPRYGGFFGSELAAHLRAIGADTLVVCGLSLAGGVETTVRDAHNHDLRSIVVEDACLIRAIPDQGWGAVSREDVRRVVLSMLAQRFARVATTAEVCGELQRLAS
jgi:ureidoacrylate peracid hydrolase